MCQAYNVTVQFFYHYNLTSVAIEAFQKLANIRLRGEPAFTCRIRRKPVFVSASRSPLSSLVAPELERLALDPKVALPASGALFALYFSRAHSRCLFVFYLILPGQNPHSIKTYR